MMNQTERESGVVGSGVSNIKAQLFVCLRTWFDLIDTYRQLLFLVHYCSTIHSYFFLYITTAYVF